MCFFKTDCLKKKVITKLKHHTHFFFTDDQCDYFYFIEDLKKFICVIKKVTR